MRSWVQAMFMLSMCLLLLALQTFGATAYASDRAAAAPARAVPPNLRQTPPSPDSTGAATANRNANLRQGPGTTYPIVGGVTAGQALDIVARNEAGDWYQLADGRWIFAALVDGAPAAGVSTAQQADAAAPAPSDASPAAGEVAVPAGGGWRVVADSAADFPGGRDRNHWYYLWTEGRGNFVWQDMQQIDGKGCYQDTAGKGLEICADSMTANPKGDVGLQWKASRGGTYRFEWDSASLKFYKHGEFVGILDQGTQLPYATTVTDVIEWELFFWVAADSTKFHVKVFSLEDAAAPADTTVAAVQAAPAPATPAAALTFGSGAKIVGRDISPGTYRNMGGGFCYWERLRGFGGTLSEIIANGLGEGPWVVTISATDKGFDSTRCGSWTLDLSPITASPTDPFGSGMYFVGKDISGGTWQSSGGAGCYWERLTGFSGEFRDIKANDLVNGPTVVEIAPGDQGFYSDRCGTWTRLY
jgi:hypothetical protein